jgi:hypothetical protein
VKTKFLTGELNQQMLISAWTHTSLVVEESSESILTEHQRLYSALLLVEWSGMGWRQLIATYIGTSASSAVRSSILTDTCTDRGLSKTT